MMAAVEEDVAFAKDIGVNATPTIFVNDRRMTGFRADEFQDLIQQEIRSAGSR